MDEFHKQPPPAWPASASQGPAWEDPARPLFERWRLTVADLFARPTRFFEAMPASGGIGSALVFGIIGGSIGLIVSSLFNMVFNVSLLAFLGDRGADAETTGRMVGNTFGGACTIVLAPLLVLVGLFISSGILHLTLMLLGGARQGYEATFRVQAYVNGSIGLLTAIPLCGGLIGGIWMIVVQIIGVSRVHGISTGHAALAVLLPLLLCAGCGLLLMLTIFSTFFFAAIAGAA